MPVFDSSLACLSGCQAVLLSPSGDMAVRQRDLIIIATFTELRTKDARKHTPEVILVDEGNRPRREIEVTAKGSNGKKQ